MDCGPIVHVVITIRYINYVHTKYNYIIIISMDITIHAKRLKEIKILKTKKYKPKTHDVETWLNFGQDVSQDVDQYMNVVNFDVNNGTYNKRTPITNQHISYKADFHLVQFSKLVEFSDCYISFEMFSVSHIY